jgi:uncharacterized repeat protein (TIGR03803 family)
MPLIWRALTISAVAFAGLAAGADASAYSEKVLHSFCNTLNCTGGTYPNGGLLSDQDGDLFGTAYEGGKYGYGIVFELVPNADKSKYTEHILYAFCKTQSCNGGGNPLGELIMDRDGALYGVAVEFGVNNGGTVFKLTHNAGQVTYTKIHNFCLQGAKCTDGTQPITGLAYQGQSSGAPWNGSSPLFGATQSGGTNNSGIAYRLAPGGSGWSYQVIHNFNAPDSYAEPGPMLVDASGNVLGVTGSGGKYGGGVLYRLAAGTWNETVLHNFCADTNCSDGRQGVGRLAMDAAGNLFGATGAGGAGAHCAEPVGCGVIFERPASGGYSIIYNFCSLSACADGYDPFAGPILDASGDLFGTTYNGGGSADAGTAFELTPGTPWAETVLYSFCAQQSCADGNGSHAPLIMDAGGNLYGTTASGGAHGGGTAFELIP